jgi:hypothetical protein
MRDLPPPPSLSQYHSRWYSHSQSDLHTSLCTYFPQHPDPSPDRTHSTTALDLYHLRSPQAYTAPRYTCQYHATQVAIPSYVMAIIPLEGKKRPSPRECSFPPSDLNSNPSFLFFSFSLVNPDPAFIRLRLTPFSSHPGTLSPAPSAHINLRRTRIDVHIPIQHTQPSHKHMNICAL